MGRLSWYSNSPDDDHPDDYYGIQDDPEPEPDYPEEPTMTRPTTPFDRALEQFKADMRWAPDRTETEKSLVLGNLNGFVALLNKQLLETRDPEILAAVSPEDLAEGHRIVAEAVQKQSSR